MSRISAAAEDGRDCVVVVTDLFATAFLRTTWLRKILGEKTAFLKDEPSPSDLVDIIVKQFKRYVIFYYESLNLYPTSFLSLPRLLLLTKEADSEFSPGSD